MIFHGWENQDNIVFYIMKYYKIDLTSKKIHKKEYDDVEKIENLKYFKPTLISEK